MSLENYDVLVLCGGYGTRLHGMIPEGLPKCLADINGRPFLDYQLEYLARQGFRRAILCTAYGSQDILFHLIPRKSPLLTLMSNEGSPKGTMVSIRTALADEQLKIDKQFFVINGDTYCNTDLSLLIHNTRHQVVFGLSELWKMTGAFFVSRGFDSDYRNIEDAIYHNPLLCTWRVVEEPFYDIGTPEGLTTFRAVASRLSL